MVQSQTIRLLAALTISAALFGCSSGDRDGTPRYGTGPIGPPTGATLEVTAVSFSPSPQPQLVGNNENVLGFVFTLEAQTAAVLIRSLTLESHGAQPRPFDNAKIADVKLVVDADANGTVDQTELSDPSTVTLGVSLPGVGGGAGNADKFTFDFGQQPLTLQPATPVQYVVLVRPDPTQLLPTDAGTSVVVDLVNNADIVAEDVNFNLLDPAADITYTNGGSGAGSGTSLLAFTGNLVVSEVRGFGSGTGSADYIEIFNPTHQGVQLAQQVYLSNYHASTADSYFLLPSYDTPPGNGFPTTGSAGASFLVRFPPSAGTLDAGSNLLIALNGDVFRSTIGQDADYCMTNNGTTTAELMEVSSGTLTFSQTAAPSSIDLADGGDSVFLFAWNGTTDLVQDHDVVHFGTTVKVADKAGVAVDGPDAGTGTNAYQAETAQATQTNNRAAAPGGAQALLRQDFTEGAEAQTGGSNGVLGDDETSEEWTNTFQSTTPTPGDVP